MRIRVFVDDMNLYNRVFKPLNIKWVDMEAMLLEQLQTKFPDAEIEKLILFTSIMNGKAGDKQRIYLSTLQKLSPKISIKEGRFVTRPKLLPVVDEESNLTGNFENVLVSEEKGTDVNIATEIIKDSLSKERDKFDIVCLVTNDSDLLYPIEVLHEFGHEVILMVPNIVEYNKKGEIIDKVSGYLRSSVSPGYLITGFSDTLLLDKLISKKVGDPPEGEGWFNNPKDYNPLKKKKKIR